MDPFLARTMVESLSKGIDPLSGRALPLKDSCSNEEIQEALLEVLAHCSIESSEQYLVRLKEETAAAFDFTPRFFVKASWPTGQVPATFPSYPEFRSSQKCAIPWALLA